MPNGHRMRRTVPGDSHHEPAGGQACRGTPDRDLSRRPDSDRARCRLVRRSDRCQDLSRTDGRRGYLEHLRGPFPDLQAIPSGGVDLNASRQWLAAGAVAVSIGGPLLGDALKGGDLDALRDRCRPYARWSRRCSSHDGIDLRRGSSRIRQRRRQPARRQAFHPISRWCGAQCRGWPHTAWGRTIWASVLGNDAHGDYLADVVGRLGITPIVRRASGPTALMFKAGGARAIPRCCRSATPAHLPVTLMRCLQTTSCAGRSQASAPDRHRARHFPGGSCRSSDAA